ncbi:RING-H2 finger protein ATL8-like [Abrus precatorius]|uniref:RING-type E3 ubiquitin transferase n=1 Tax=Abrus precatorius TaxID=3816 RepID=A0A8B8LS67_ABRPR|nr:RING-H2 finger protein ATL8-like [Abrus precatorius]
MPEFQPKHFHSTLFTWVYLLFLRHHVVDAQSSMEPVPTYINHHNWEPSVAITVGAIICALLFMGIISIYIRRCAESHIIITQATTNTTHFPCSCSQGINKELLNTFPTFFYSNIKDLKKGKEALECAVCLTDFKEKDTLRLLPKCNHVFHPQCIDSWLASHVTCPVCRANLNQDSCHVAITVPTQLSTDDESGTRTETGEENQQEPNPNINTNPNPNPNPNQNQKQNQGEVNGSSDDGGASKWNLLRSNSTGHSLVEPGKCVERYTLRLPEDVRTYILVNHGSTVQRSLSYHTNNNNNVVKGMCWSDSEESNGGKRINGEVRVERWVLCTPPFVGRHG